MLMLHKIRGLTLIEVLIALAIIAIAMTAIIKATSQVIRGNHHLQNKTIALWVGQQVLNQAKVGVLKLPKAPAKLKDMTSMLGQDWYWQASIDSTANRHIKKIEIDVFASDNEQVSPLTHLESYIYHAS